MTLISIKFDVVIFVEADYHILSESAIFFKRHMVSIQIDHLFMYAH